MKTKPKRVNPGCQQEPCSALTDAEKYADPSGPQRMRGCSQERVEEKLRIALDGHPESELWGENGLIAATMRCARMAMELDGEYVVDHKDGYQYAGPFKSEEAAREWIALQPNRTLLLPVMIARIPLSNAKGDAPGANG